MLWCFGFLCSLWARVWCLAEVGSSLSLHAMLVLMLRLFRWVVACRVNLRLLVIADFVIVWLVRYVFWVGGFGFLAVVVCWYLLWVLVFTVGVGLLLAVWWVGTCVWHNIVF